MSIRALDRALYGSFFIYAATVVATPMCLLAIADEFSLSLTLGGGIEIARSMLIFAMLLFSGYAASRWGKIKVMTLALAWIAGGLLIYSAARGYGMILMAMALVGMGSGFIEALSNPLVRDLHPRTSAHHLNVSNAFFSIGVSVTVVGIGELLTAGVSWRTVFFILGICTLCLVIYFPIAGRGIALPASNHSRFHIRQIIGNRRFWITGAALFLGGALESAFTFWSASYLQLHFFAAPRLSGVGTACFAAGMAMGRIITARLSRRFELSSIIMWSAFLGICVGTAAQLVDGMFIFFIVLITAGFSVACYWPTIQIYAAVTMRVDATLLFIYLSCFGISGFGVTPMIMGYIGDRASLQQAFWIVPICSLLMIGIMAYDRRHGGKG